MVNEKYGFLIGQQDREKLFCTQIVVNNKDQNTTFAGQFIIFCTTYIVNNLVRYKCTSFCTKLNVYKFATFINLPLSYLLIDVFILHQINKITTTYLIKLRLNKPL